MLILIDFIANHFITRPVKRYLERSDRECALAKRLKDVKLYM